jgi:hypothetical protein
VPNVENISVMVTSIILLSKLYNTTMVRPLSPCGRGLG